MKTAEELAAMAASYEKTAAYQNMNLAHQNYQKALTDEFQIVLTKAYAQGMTDAAALIDFDLPSTSNYKKILSARDQKGKTE